MNIKKQNQKPGIQRLSSQAADGVEGTGGQDDEDSDDVGIWDAMPFLSALLESHEHSSDEQARPDRRKTRLPWRLKEPFSGFSHLLGVALSVAALWVLIDVAWGRPLRLIGFGLYGVSLIALFTASSLYHSLRVAPATVGRLQRLDYMAIFLLIAGTYAPICLVSLHGPWGWSLFGSEYGMAFVGIVSVALLRRRLPEWVRVGLCAVMTWLILVAVVPLRSVLPEGGLAWLLSGLVTYTIGTLILATDWPHLSRGRFSAHDLWHLFVLGGSTCHFILILCYVAPSRLPN